MAIPPLAMTPSAVAQAYRTTAAGGEAGFGDVLQSALQGVIDVNAQAEAKSVDAIAGRGSLTDVVTAVTKAELALQTTVAIRDRVVQAYQDIMKMPI